MSKCAKGKGGTRNKVKGAELEIEFARMWMLTRRGKGGKSSGASRGQRTRAKAGCRKKGITQGKARLRNR